MEFKKATISFKNLETGDTKTQTVPFTVAIKKAVIVLQGFNFDFKGNVEHPVDKIEVKVDTVGNPAGATVVEASAKVAYTGKVSSEFEYNADVHILVIAEV
jgi:hypothetical protein